ncbi:MAG TPA: hypothetical protein ACFCUC_17815 [Desulfobacterales bacterium]
MIRLIKSLRGIVDTPVGELKNRIANHAIVAVLDSLDFPPDGDERTQQQVILQHVDALLSDGHGLSFRYRPSADDPWEDVDRTMMTNLMRLDIEIAEQEND